MLFPSMTRVMLKPPPPSPFPAADDSPRTLDVTWQWHGAQSCWIQGDGEVSDVVSPILADALEVGDATETFFGRILETLKSAQIRHNTRFWKSGMSKPEITKILHKALAALDGKGTLARMCIANNEFAMSLDRKSLCAEIVTHATHDLLWRLQRGGFHNEPQYRYVTHDEWQLIDQHERLAISFALRPHAASFTHSSAVIDGWEKCKDEDFDKYVHEKVAPCIRLSHEMAKIRQTHHDKYTINVIGPFSLAISCVLAEAPFDKPAVAYSPWPTKNPENIARAAASAFAYLCASMKDSGHHRPSQVEEKFKEGVLKGAPDVICALGCKARKAFHGILSEESIWDIVVEYECRKDKNLLHLCKFISRLDDSSAYLTCRVLEQDYQIELRDSLKFIKVLCQKNPAATSNVDAEEVRMNFVCLAYDTFALACMSVRVRSNAL
jgi:hypothetical protein